MARANGTFLRRRRENERRRESLRGGTKEGRGECLRVDAMIDTMILVKICMYGDY